MTRRLAPVALAAVAVAVYFIVDPRVADLPAAQYRTWLFEQHGFTIWDNGWYSGHHTPSYSILFPPLAALLGGPEVVGALCALAMAALFPPLVERHFGEKAALWPSLWFGLAATTPLWGARLPWALGAAFGLAALLALQRERKPLAIVLTIAATLSSPVAGAFLALGGAALFLTGRRAIGVALVLAGLGPPLVLNILFPEGGAFPFAFTSYWIVPVLALGSAALLPRSERTLRITAVLYALAATAAIAIDTALGGNAVRLGQLLGGPVVLAALLAHRPDTRVRRIAAVVLVALFAYWQLWPLSREIAKTVNDPAAQANYFTPLNGFLAAHHTTGRVEIPELRSQAESYYVAKHFPLARGWERQLDRKLNGDLFYTGQSAGRPRLRGLPARERGRLRRPAGREARLRGRPRGSADQDRQAALPEAGRPRRALADLRRHPVPAQNLHPPDDGDRRGRQARHRPRPLVAVLAPDERLRRACRRLDARRAARHRTGAPGDPLPAGPRPSMPFVNAIESRASWLASGISAAVGCHKGWLDALRQLALFASAYYFYRIVRGVVDGQTAIAFDHARDLVGIERSTGLFFEPGLQHWALGHHWIVDVANWSYINSHFLVTTAFLIWLYLARNESYYYVRNMFMVAMGLALVAVRRLPHRAAALPARVGLQRHRHRRRRPGRARTTRTCSTTRTPRSRACTWRSP